MKEKQGFTLIELLAVIVILAIIALISTPIVLNIINTSRKGASITSARGYIRAVNNEILANEMDQVNMFQNGTYNIDELLVEVSGNLPEKGTVTIDNDKVSKAELCFNGYLIKYDGTTYEINGECKKISTVTLNINESKENKKTENLSVEFNIENYKNGTTNISCNNGVTLSIDGNILKVDNVFADTECNISSSLNDTITELYDTKNYILMINDIEVADTILVEANKDVILDLNGKNITTLSSCRNTLQNNGKLTINDSIGTGTMKTAMWLLKNVSELTINGGNFIKEIADGIGGVISNGGLVTINDGYFYAEKAYVFYNYVNNSVYNPIFNVNGGIIKSPNSSEFVNMHSKGTFNIKNVNLSDLGEQIVFNNYAGGVFNISDVLIDSGGLQTIYNAKQGIINIKNSTIINPNGSITDNLDNGIINVDNCKFNAKSNGIGNSGLGTVNICGGTINGITNDVFNKGNGYVYYNDSNIFKNNSLNDTVNNPSHIILNPDLSCEQ